jgi:hypothetical protein
MSQRYRFYNTAHVVEALMAHQFVPVRAQQSRTRIAGKGEFTKHLLRFRHESMTEKVLNQEVPEIVLINSHDGTSAYQISLGLFRLVCLNGLMVKSASIEEVKVRHSGREDLIRDVIDASDRVIDQAPKTLEQVTAWKAIQLTPPEQEILAESALAVRESALEIEPRRLLTARRFADGSGLESRDLWRTMNVVQENVMRGGVQGTSPTNGRTRRLQGIHSVDGETRMNRALWLLTERMAELKGQ